MLKAISEHMAKLACNHWLCIQTGKEIKALASVKLFMELGLLDENKVMRFYPFDGGFELTTIIDREVKKLSLVCFNEENKLRFKR